jgi:hypothetical protein
VSGSASLQPPIVEDNLLLAISCRTAGSLSSSRLIAKSHREMQLPHLDFNVCHEHVTLERAHNVVASKGLGEPSILTDFNTMLLKYLEISSLKR